MANRAEYEKAMMIEREHMRTYQWFIKEVGRGHIPKVEEFLLHIIQDHMAQDPEYYKKLSTIVTGPASRPLGLDLVSSTPDPLE